jgi:hypothetical protein
MMGLSPSFFRFLTVAFPGLSATPFDPAKSVGGGFSDSLGCCAPFMSAVDVGAGIVGVGWRAKLAACESRPVHDFHSVAGGK